MLFFHLQQQRLIELIRAGRTEQALVFAQEYLAPHGEENEAFLEELGEANWWQQGAAGHRGCLCVRGSSLQRCEGQTVPASLQHACRGCVQGFG